MASLLTTFVNVCVCVWMLHNDLFCFLKRQCCYWIDRRAKTDDGATYCSRYLMQRL